MYRPTYFKPEEFLNCSPPCMMEQMQDEFLIKLDLIREEAKRPLVLTSAYRSPDWEVSKGRPENGPHTTGLAADIYAGDSCARYDVIRAAIACGVDRIGVGKTFVHVDIDKGQAPKVVWLY